MNYNNEEFIQYNKKKKKKETKSIALYLTTHITLYIVLIFFLIFFAWYTYFVATHRYYIVYGPSMKPILNDTIADDRADLGTDAVYVDTTGKIKVGDIVVIENVSTESESIIKRVVAEEGDFVTIAQDNDGYYYLYKIQSAYIKENADGEIESLITDDEAKVVENKRLTGYTIEYDKWANENPAGRSYQGVTYDAKFYNKFIDAYIKGNNNYNYYISSSNLIYFQVPENYTFCLGDNRAHSNDSRYYGFISKDDIVGNVDIIVYDYSFGNQVLEVIKFYYKEVEEFFAR